MSQSPKFSKIADVIHPPPETFHSWYIEGFLFHQAQTLKSLDATLSPTKGKSNLTLPYLSHMSHLQTAGDPAKTLLFELDSKELPLVLESDFERYFNFFSLEFLSNSSCFREIALSESACSTEYKSIINEVMTNNDNSNDTTDDDETPEVTLTRLCWYVSRLP